MVAHTFLITGASSGIGVQVVYAALAAGHKVLAATRNPQAAAVKYPTVQQQGGQWVEIDVDKRETETAVEKLVKENNVDILVCNAGYAMLGPLEEMR